MSCGSSCCLPRTTSDKERRRRRQEQRGLSCQPRVPPRAGARQRQWSMASLRSTGGSCQLPLGLAERAFVSHSRLLMCQPLLMGSCWPLVACELLHCLSPSLLLCCHISTSALLQHLHICSAVTSPHICSAVTSPHLLCLISTSALLSHLHICVHMLAHSHTQYHCRFADNFQLLLLLP